jgi:hypothetical protein
MSLLPPIFTLSLCVPPLSLFIIITMALSSSLRILCSLFSLHSLHSSLSSHSLPMDTRPDEPPAASELLELSALSSTSAAAATAAAGGSGGGDTAMAQATFELENNIKVGAPPETVQRPAVVAGGAGGAIAAVTMLWRRRDWRPQVDGVGGYGWH